VSALAGNTDPLSSHAAAAALETSGARAVQKHQALQAVRNFPGHTSLELAALIGGGTETRYMLARRLADLKHDGMVVNGGLRACRQSGHQATTWYVAGTEPTTPAAVAA
jgi:hypothetical protein